MVRVENSIIDTNIVRLTVLSEERGALKMRVWVV